MISLPALSRYHGCNIACCMKPVWHPVPENGIATTHYFTSFYQVPTMSTIFMCANVIEHSGSPTVAQTLLAFACKHSYIVPSGKWYGVSFYMWPFHQLLSSTLCWFPNCTFPPSGPFGVLIPSCHNVVLGPSTPLPCPIMIWSTSHGALDATTVLLLALRAWPLMIVLQQPSSSCSPMWRAFDGLKANSLSWFKHVVCWLTEPQFCSAKYLLQAK